MNKNVNLSSLVHNKERNFNVQCHFGMYSHNNRESLDLHKCVNNDPSASVTSSAGIFLRDYFPWAIVPQKMPAQQVYLFLLFTKKLELSNQIAELS